MKPGAKTAHLQAELSLAKSALLRPCRDQLRCTLAARRSLQFAGLQVLTPSYAHEAVAHAQGAFV